MWKSWLVAAALLVSVPVSARADSEVDILLKKLVEKGVLTGEEAGEIRGEIAETKDVRNKQVAKEILPDNWAWKGDIRLRNEYRDQSGESRENFNRQRIRVRLGGEGKVNGEELKAGFRIATGEATNPRSTNQTLDDTFSKKSVFLDLAYLAYAPELPVGRAAITGGLFESPFWAPSPSQIVFDSDLSFAGGALKYAYDFGAPATASLFTTLGAFPVDSDGIGGRTVTMYSAQTGMVLTPWIGELESPEHQKNFKLTGALAYHDLSNVVDGGALVVNTPTTAGASNSAFAEDFDLLNANVEVGTVIGGYPMSAYYDFVNNFAAPGDKHGFNTGIKVGKAKNPWSLKDGWEAGVFFQRLEMDAAFDGFTDSDFNGGGTNNEGFAYWLTLAVLKNTTFGMKVLDAQTIQDPPKVDTMTVQWDLATKF